ncbi:hypothetical protein GCM10009560_56150 [Nonomuraea longicatena]|uniref:Uncharacterized protein n=1 Tax=Nonomuraea longicatena TaxID=83682 RepID=A0ABN1QI85_9ACTN
MLLRWWPQEHVREPVDRLDVLAGIGSSVIGPAARREAAAVLRRLYLPEEALFSPVRPGDAGHMDTPLPVCIQELMARLVGSIY